MFLFFFTSHICESTFYLYVHSTRCCCFVFFHFSFTATFILLSSSSHKMSDFCNLSMPATVCFYICIDTKIHTLAYIRIARVLYQPLVVGVFTSIFV